MLCCLIYGTTKNLRGTATIIDGWNCKLMILEKQVEGKWGKLMNYFYLFKADFLPKHCKFLQKFSEMSLLFFWYKSLNVLIRIWRTLQFRIKYWYYYINIILNQCIIIISLLLCHSVDKQSSLKLQTLKNMKSNLLNIP